MESEVRFGVFRKNIRGKKVYYYWYYGEDGIRKQRSTGMNTKAKAMDVIVRRLAEGTLCELPVREQTFAEFATPYWVWDTCPIIKSKIKRGGKLSQKYCANNRRILEQHVLPFFKNRKVSAITPAMIENWLIDLPEKKHISAKTANDAYNVIKQMLDSAVSMRIIQRNPCSSIKKLIKNPNPRGCFTTDQITSLFSSAWDNKMAYTACLLSATTGMRLGEIRALTVEQIHSDFIDVNASWGEMDNRKSTKSGKDRVVPLCREVHDLLMEIKPNDDGLIFTLNGDVPVDRHFIVDRLEKQMAKVGIDYKGNNLTFHSFRHFFNTRLIAEGVNGEVTRATIGHESAEMTENYLHLTVSDMDSIKKIQDKILKKIS